MTVRQFLVASTMRQCGFTHRQAIRYLCEGGADGDADPLGKAQRLLAHRFGFTDFADGQREVIAHLLAGDSAAAIFPTGGGKSLLYQLPALLLDGLTVVISPLLALMREQVDVLRSVGYPAARLDSTLAAWHAEDVLAGVRDQEIRLLYVSPERTRNEAFLTALRGMTVSLLAVDEAHCISEWGHNFRPVYLALPEFARGVGAQRVLALTATATARVADDLAAGFGIRPGCVVRRPTSRPNLDLRFTAVSGDQRDGLLVERLRSRPPGATVCYVTFQETAERVAAHLRSAGLPARHYHAGMPDADRRAVQDAFLKGGDTITVATVAFGMGVDRADVRYVYPYNLPKSLENYAQEIGRAGRDGAPAVCELLLCPDDLPALENFAYGDTPTRADVRSFVEELFGQGSPVRLAVRGLADRHDIREAVAATLLAYLEGDGVLLGELPEYDSWRLKLLDPVTAIQQYLPPAERQLLTEVLGAARAGRVWHTLTPAAAADRLGVSRYTLSDFLDGLDQAGWIEFERQGLRSVYTVLRPPADRRGLADRLHRRLVEREQREVARVGEMVALATFAGCQANRLAVHFGEDPAGPCGNCQWCRTGQPVRPPDQSARPLDCRLVDRALALRQQRPELQGDLRRLAKFLVGISSPPFRAKELKAHQLFGVCAGRRLPDVHGQLDPHAGV